MSKIKVNQPVIEKVIKELLVLLGEDPDREGLKETPQRVARFWSEFILAGTNGIPREGTTFSMISDVDQMVVIKDMRVWSLCEHHLLPFHVDVTIAYIPTDKVLGLSKFARIAHKLASRLTLQEQIIQDIADKVKELTGSDSVAVMGTGIHLCMVMRGVKTPSSVRSSVMTGAFLDNQTTRSEFMRLAG